MLTGWVSPEQRKPPELPRPQGSGQSGAPGHLAPWQHSVHLPGPTGHKSVGSPRRFAGDGIVPGLTGPLSATGLGPPPA